MAIGTLNERQLTEIQKKVFDAFYVEPTLYNYIRKSKVNNRKIKEGMKKFETWVWNKMKAGQVSMDLRNLPEDTLTHTKGSGRIVYLGSKLVITKEDQDAWRNTDFEGSGTDLIAKTLSSKLEALTNQLDQLLAYGYQMKTPLDSQVLAAYSDVVGLLNGFTTSTGGIGGDNNMTAYGDYTNTITNFNKLFRNNGYGNGKYLILSDVDTKSAMELHFVGATGVYEATQIMDIHGDKIDVWIDSPNATTSASAHRIAMARLTDPKGQPTFRMVESYPLTIMPLYGGNLTSNLSREFAAFIGVGMEVIRSDGCIHTGDLTIA